MDPNSSRTSIVVVGAGGRAGRAIVAEALDRGRTVVAVVRDATSHADLAASGVTLVEGDAADAETLGAAGRGAGAIVIAVTPFSAPPASFAGFDPATFERQAQAVCAGARAAAISRIVDIGLFATLKSGTGHVYEDETRFPSDLRPFAVARARGVAALAEHGAALDWVVLTPTAGLSIDAPQTGGYRIDDDRPRLEDLTATLSYADLAAATIDEIDRPTRHREQVTVHPAT